MDTDTVRVDGHGPATIYEVQFKTKQAEKEEDSELIEFIDDLTFGQYIRLIEKEENWQKLNLKIERVPFIKQLNRIREIRNDIMHFDPEGISEEQREALINMANFLTELNKYY